MALQHFEYITRLTSTVTRLTGVSKQTLINSSQMSAYQLLEILPRQSRMSISLLFKLIARGLGHDRDLLWSETTFGLQSNFTHSGLMKTTTIAPRENRH